MGFKNVLDRIKGKSDSNRSDAKDKAATRRDTSEETVQVGVGNANSPFHSNREQNCEQQDETVVAPPLERPMPRAPVQPPAAPIPERQQDQIKETVVAPPSSAPVPQQPAPSVAPMAAPSPAPPAAPPPAAVAAPSAAPPQAPPAAHLPSTIPVEHKSASVASPAVVSSADQTQYVIPEKAEANELAGVLVGIFGETKNQVFLVLNGNCTLGRSDTCEIQILDAKVSREHAAISCEQGSVVITPLNERNPVFVNDRAITEPSAIADGDMLQFGNTGTSIFRFRTIEGP